MSTQDPYGKEIWLMPTGPRWELEAEAEAEAAEDNSVVWEFLVSVRLCRPRCPCESSRMAVLSDTAQSKADCEPHEF